MATTSFILSNYVTILGSCTVVGKGAGTSLNYTNATGTTIIGASAGISLVNGPDNVIIGNGADVASNTGQCTIIGQRAMCNATSPASKVILLGDDATISATHTAVCVMGGKTNKMSIVDYGRGHMFYIIPATYNASATITGAAICSGLVTFTGGAFTCTFPTEKSIFDAMKDPAVGSGLRLMIYKYSAGTLSLTTTNLSDYLGVASIATNSSLYFYFAVTDATPAAPHFKVRSSKCNLHN